MCINALEMTVFLVFLLLFLLSLAVLLWAPLVLEFDTRRSVYRLDWWYLLRAWVEPAENDIFIHGQVLFFRRRWSLIELLARRREHKDETKKPKRKKKSGRFGWKNVKRLMKTFSVDRFDIAVDTGDVVLNAMLFPIAEVLHYVLNVRHKGFHINFIGDNHLDLKISNRAGRLAWAFVPSLFTS